MQNSSDRQGRHDICDRLGTKSTQSVVFQLLLGYGSAEVCVN